MTPKEALEQLRLAAEISYDETSIREEEFDGMFEEDKKAYDIIEQALTELEKQTQILKILKEKVVDIWEILNSVDYNDWLVCYKPTNKKYLLTKEEFDLLKEWLNEN